ncbi:uncharacterized protein N7459_001042 [Penicillium hispanicum]|uniref:uncharacterized protein n=1 Tax=Penicillium hispanicum TaxID=1080232 RepID=UPI0025418956|nr:uncharacterized protein N7459_001042 [Penicillium hispanicum]KAJ5594834.1 hypothetical protein N7459_001042 [Penicillium hispanicum]
MSSPSPEATTSYTNDDGHVLARAASYADLPSQPASSSDPPDLRRTFSDYAVPTLSDSPTKESVAAGKDILRRTSLRSKNRPLAPISHFTLSSSEDLKDTEAQDGGATVPETRPPEPVARPSKGRSMSGRIVSLARKPWGSSSRSPSPSAKRTKQRGEDQSPTRPGGRSTPDSAQPSRKRTILYKRPRRPMLAVVAKGNEDSPGSPSSPSNSLRHQTSFEKFTASLSVSTPVLPPMPKGAAATVAAYHNSNPDTSRKKDELWGIFRGLEADYQKFQSKSSALKANVIRSSLLPFLGRHHLHASCKNLRPEDLDRRVNILNKWWIGMLEMLNGKNNQSISGTDRPVFLEAVVGIMTRPEWRIPFPTAQPNGGPADSLKYAASTSVSETSEGSGSSGSDFLVESIHHNIRNIFVQNLLSQMAFVVERMSMRHAPASLVTFCGKASAYAFFFCPGVADILARLWNAPPAIFRRILAESAQPRASNLRTYTQELSLSFPMALRPLAFHSHAPLLRYLRRKPDAPLNTTNIPWHGPWIARWCGRDTDLFYVFVKYIHILYAEYLPSETEKGRRILAPGLPLIHAQLLVAIEDTIYKQSIQQMPENPHTAAAITFDDFIESPDSSASSQPLGGRNSHRSMAENRLIILLRDFLSDSSAEPNRSRLLYAEMFCGILKITAQRISLFDHNACFLLCDFLEEVIPILTRYAQSIESELFDWGFWLEVCRQMMQSHNSLTEVRVFSFIYCVWGTWTAMEERKAGLCLDFLLHEPIFFHYFNHWSPMVRAYFHRLLCWRVGRFNGDPSALDSMIYETLSARLLRVWEYYIGFQSKAEEGLTASLSSAPCTPAPGRRIIIIRCDNQLSPVNLFVSFDRVVPPVPPDQVMAHRRSGSTDSTGSEGSSSSSSKKRWGILRAMFGNSSSNRSADGSSSDESDNGTVDLTLAPDSRCMDEHELTPNNSTDDLVRPKTPTHQPFFFKFSLEWMDRPQWPTKNKRLFAPCLPVASQLHIQHRRSPAKSSDFQDAVSETASILENTTDEKQLDEPADHNEPPSESAPESRPRPPTTKNSPLPELPSQPAYDHVVPSKYAGRALAEWAHIVSECDSFFARRRDEGVPSDRTVETPALGVESFRK